MNVWTTWCGPCQAELPLVQKLHDEMKNKPNVLILTFNCDSDPGLVSSHMKRNKFSFPVLFASTYVNQVRPDSGFPQSWIIDFEGRIRHDHVGFDPTKKEPYVTRIRSLIEKYSAKN